MPCYSYSANLPILSTNVEAVFNATGGTTFSYDSLYYICEIPISNQIYVYTRPSVNGVETLRVENTEYTIQGTNIVFNSAPSGQVVIRRITNDQRMLTVFSDGAKLSATELNSAFHQLLFLVQEKELSGSTYNNVFTDLNSIPAWNAGSVYQIGAIVTFSGSVYRCLQLTSAGQSPTTHPAKWTLVTASSFNFVSIGGPNPVIFDFENLDPNSTLSWDGTKFVASNGVSTDLTSLTDVTLSNPPANNDILKYDSTTSRWINTQASFNLFSTPVVTPGRAFQNLATNLSYTNGGVAVDVGSDLDQFRNANNNWVLPDPPTVYSIIQTCVPAIQTNNPVITDLRQYLTSIETRFLNVASNIANPVKVKFLWNLNENRQNILDSATGNMLDGYQSMYWNKPSELYSAADGYYVSAGTQLKFHGILTGGNTYTTSPYFTRTTIGASTTFKSKISCYGIRHFYLSVPECATSNLSSIPVIIGGSFVSTSTLPDLTQQLKVNTNPNTIDKNSLVTVKHHDFYLAAIRDFAFASMNDRTTNAVSGDTPLYNLEYSTDTYPATAGDNNAIVKERFVRKRKSSFIGAEYNSFTDVNFKRLEGNEIAASVLWKIPKQIIYYNRQALALSASGTQPVLTADGLGLSQGTPTPVAGTQAYIELEQNFNTLKKELRWEGWSKPTQLTYAQSTTTELNDGTVFKADGVWSAWNYQWNSQYYLLGGINPEVFGLADIDWMAQEVGTLQVTDTMKFFSLGKPEYAPPIVRSGLGATGNPLLGSAISTNGDPLSPVGIYGGDWWPWHYRPNDIRVSSISSSWPDGLIGTHLLNIDANKLFSEASRFVPDPVDEYVFRLVCKKNLTNSFRNAGDSSNKLRTSILLEHGFASNSRFSDNTILTSLNQVFENNIKTATSNYLKTRVDHSKIKVYVKNEAIEQIGSDSRLVVTIGIIVPRVKSIGYSRIFRKLTPLGSQARIRDGTTVDTEKDYGPWNWDLEVYNTDYGVAASDYYTTGIDSFDAGAGLNSAVDWYNFDDYTTQWNSEYQGYHNGSYNASYNWTNRIATGNISTKTVFSRHNYKATSPANKDNAWTTANNTSISGRNECAVKFVNVGIPSDLWIRLSILNTDATLDLIEGTVSANQGLNTTTISET